MRCEASAASEVTISGRSPATRASRAASRSACSLSIATTSPPASGCAPARSDDSSAWASRSTCSTQSPSGSSAVRRRRAASAAGSATLEVGAAAAPVAHPLHVAAVGVEGDGAADAVEQRVGVAVREVGAARRRRRRSRPTGSACCRSGTACRRAAAGSGRARRPASVLRPQAASSPMWCGSSAISSVGDSAQRRRCTRRAGGERGVGDRDAVAVARLRPGGVRPVGLEVDPVAGGVERPLAADVRGRRDRPRRGRPGPRRASGGRCAGRTWSCRRRASPRRGTPSPSWSRTASAAACCQARSGRPVGHAGRDRRRRAAGLVTADDKGAGG